MYEALSDQRVISRLVSNQFQLLKWYATSRIKGFLVSKDPVVLGVAATKDIAGTSRFSSVVDDGMFEQIVWGVGERLT